MQWRSVAAVAVIAVALAAGCGSGDDAPGGPVGANVMASSRDLPLAVETPTTIVGLLEVSVEEGSVGDSDISEFNFGTVQLDGEVEGGYVLVEIPGDVVRAAGVSRDDLFRSSRYQVSLSGPSDLVVGEGIATYVVEALTPVD